MDQVSCIVAIGPRASDSHYAPVGDGETINRGDLLLIDLWGAFEGMVFADQTWMGFMGAEVDARTQEVWEAVRDVRYVVELASASTAHCTSPVSEVRPTASISFQSATDSESM